MRGESDPGINGPLASIHVFSDHTSCPSGNRRPSRQTCAGSAASHPEFKHIAARYIVPASTPSSGLRLAFDAEADGFVDQATKVHCIVVADLDSEQIDAYGPDRMTDALAHLLRADYLVGHNICGYDLPLLRRLYNWAPRSDCTVVDTLVASRLILPNLDDLDDQAAAMGDPPLGKLRGRHSLEAWGARLGIPKSVPTSPTGQSGRRKCRSVAPAMSQSARRYGVSYSLTAIARRPWTLEHRVAAICNRITADGVPFDIDAADTLPAMDGAPRRARSAAARSSFPDVKLELAAADRCAA